MRKLTLCILTSQDYNARHLFAPLWGLLYVWETNEHMTKLTNGMIGEIAYTLRVDGHIIEEITADDAIEYLHGADNLVPGLEAALEGKQAGDAFAVTVAPADGYGDYNEDDIEDLPVDDIDAADELEPGMEIELMDEEGDFYEGTVLEVTDEYVRVDFNPTLAGKTLNYEVEVIKVRNATAEELEAGLPQSLIDEMEDEDYEDDDDDHRH